MKELSLFSGAGGGLLGTQHLLGWNCTGYVEINEYCQRVIAQRINDGYLPNAPIFSDVRTFASEGYASAYQGMVDVVTAGFPCQPFSLAGQQRGAEDNRNLWPETAKIIALVRPRYVFLENVPGLISSGYVLTVAQDLESLGYTVESPLLLAASDCGAHQKRERVWILAHTAHQRCETRASKVTKKQRKSKKSRHQIARSGDDSAKLHTSDTQSLRPRRVAKGQKRQCQPQPNRHHPLSTSANSQGLEKPHLQQNQQPPTQRSDRGWWEISDTQKRLCAAQGISDGLAHWVDRIEATGNGQVSLVAATAWNILIQEAHKNAP